MLRRDDVTCLITGAARGIGSAIASRPRPMQRTRFSVTWLRSVPRSWRPALETGALDLAADATDDARTTEVAALAVATSGSLEVVFNNCALGTIVGRLCRVWTARQRGRRPRDAVYASRAPPAGNPLQTQPGLDALLASGDADYGTGQCINVDGGMVLD
jgi:NAD(P)-dependent dehydrogenase (short-subunit alcohol dehydrogenase family)